MYQVLFALIMMFLAAACGGAEVLPDIQAVTTEAEVAVADASPSEVPLAAQPDTRTATDSAVRDTYDAPIVVRDTYVEAAAYVDVQLGVPDIVGCHFFGDWYAGCGGVDQLNRPALWVDCIDSYPATATNRCSNMGRGNFCCESR